MVGALPENKVNTKQGILDDNSFCVTMDDVKNFVSLRYPDKKISSVDTMYFGVKTQITFYRISFDRGWALLSMDKRYPPVVAFSDTGKSENLIDPVNSWLSTVSRNMSENRDIDGETNANVEFWNFITPYKLADTNDAKTKSSTQLWCKRYIGTYEDSVEEQYDINHLVPTKWGQGWPWNVSMPTIDGVHCLAGCTAVAMAQLIYYWHNRAGVPSFLWHDHFFYGITSEGELVGYSKTNQVMNSNRWSQMPLTWSSDTERTKYVSDLMLDIGNLSHMEYGLSSSGAFPCVSAFNEYCLSCTESNVDYYSFPIVKGNIINGKPICMVAYNDDGDGHTFLIDGYKQTDHYWCNEYRWERVTENTGWPDYFYTDQDIIEMELDEEDEPVVGRRITSIIRLRSDT